MSIWEMCKALYDKLITSAENQKNIDITLYGYEPGDSTGTGVPAGIKIPVGVYKRVKATSGVTAHMYSNSSVGNDVYHNFTGIDRGAIVTGTLIPEDVDFIRFFLGPARGGWITLSVD